MKIAIIDDHKILTDLIKQTLDQAKGSDQVTIYNNPKDFIATLTHANTPDIIILDIVMPQLNGMEIIKYCNAKFSNKIKILVLSMINDLQNIRKILQSGAHGFMNKESALNYLLSGIACIMAEDGPYLCPASQKLFVNNLVSEDKAAQFNLSPQEHHILNLLCKSLTAKEIAGVMNLSLHTVYSYKKNLMKKLNVNRTVDLVLFAINNGLSGRH